MESTYRENTKLTSMKKYFYVRITKCACQTVYHDIYKNDERFINPVFAGLSSSSRSPIDKQLLLSDSDFVYHHSPEVFTFSFVRNPFDRAVSSYIYCKRERAIDRDVGFSDFLELSNHLIKKDSKKLNNTELFIKRHVMPQIDWLTENKTPICDYVGKIEHLKGHVAELDKILKVSKERKITRRNSSRPKGDAYSTYYTRKEIDIVKRIYSEDLVRFKYAFDEKEDENSESFQNRNY